MDRLVQASQPLTVDTVFGVFTFHRYRIADYARVEARVRRACVDAGFLGAADALTTLDKIMGLGRAEAPAEESAGDGEGPAAEPINDAAFSYMLIRMAAQLDVLSDSKPTQFGSWLDVEDAEELTRVSGVVREWLDSFRGGVRDQEAGVGSPGQ